MAIWRGQASIEQLNRMQHGSMAQHLGIVLTELGPDFLRGTMPVDARTIMPFGSIHGGASVVLAETLGSVASNAVVDLGRQSCVGQEINANHIRPAPPGMVVTGTAKAVHLGRSSHVWGIDIVDPAGRLVCIARLTMTVLDRPPPVRLG
jgi:1,4-dihydroxy-2-naphthoyl-CoA hydrolase